MKIFLHKILTFFLPIVTLAFPLDFGISYFLKQSNQFSGEYEVMNDIYNSKAGCDIAVYGSSRAWVHIDPKILNDTLNKTVYNFGIDGHNFWMQYWRHLELLKYNIKPKTIIFSVDIFSLQKRTDLYEPDQFLPYMLMNENIKKFTDSYIGYSDIDYYIPLMRYIGKSNALKTSFKILFNKTSPGKYRQKGYKGMDRVWNSDFENAKAKQTSYEIKLDKKSIELFEKFIQECKEIGTDLILVYTPEYIEGQKFVKDRNEIINIYKTFSKKYDLKFYDYSNDEICLDKSLFYNASHLNKTGAELFSRKFAQDLKNKN